MSPPESRLPADWFSKAEREMQRVDILLAADDVEGAGFHLQQAAEMYLKGYLLGKGWEFKRIHDLEVLLNEASVYDTRFEAYADACIMAREFYVELRYPFIDSQPPAESELRSVIHTIREMVGVILED